MSKVIIVVNAEVTETGKIIPISPATERMVIAMREAIATDSSQSYGVEVIANAELWSNVDPRTSESEDVLYCPLTIHLPSRFEFPGQSLYKACDDIQSQRQWVQENLEYKTGDGHFWLPILLTAKGPIYGEVIGEKETPNAYEQPIDLPDSQRQSLYTLGYQILDHLKVIPSVYLVQFGIQKKTIIFDRLWPFPAAPAIASINVQTPNLFACHWLCLTHQPILDVFI